MEITIDSKGIGGSSIKRLQFIAESGDRDGSGWTGQSGLIIIRILDSNTQIAEALEALKTNPHDTGIYGYFPKEQVKAALQAITKRGV